MTDETQSESGDGFSVPGERLRAVRKTCRELLSETNLGATLTGPMRSNGIRYAVERMVSAMEGDD